MNAGVQIQGLTKTYRGPGGSVPAVRGIDFSIAPSEVLSKGWITTMRGSGM